MADETDQDEWPSQPSWGFAALTLCMIVAAVVVVWAVNYWQAFGGGR